MRWIVGLGNPGPAYESTRHNAGFMVVDELAKRWNVSVTPNSKCKGLMGEARIQGEKVALLKPMTFMNLSGESVRGFMDFYKARLEDMIVVYDDLDTETGRIRLRYQGSAGGHNGIKSIIQHVGTQTFNRVRMGISRPKPGVQIVDYVLGTFPKGEQPEVRRMVEEACDAIEFALSHPFEETMAKYNGRGPDKG
ncbi:aminoacyl-tRNA hydrolase [Cohnella lubricantis]|uniref:Peptidyl-tRNA hydrolase n=1 Tax=Cohnella lubricantis TaxID=2163172 RepID=A0A841TCW1_9BACL|nr:aminoacyl-tRNA hydrolase [Cohnella lubricantis]MBB6679144.1 aminoacyl-tRNA hydrolase [Cohnella lubricantis]MBP2119353.1 PTH1 family peptidyl-tRNA hydrolase [Cohnella lubricantis]